MIKELDHYIIAIGASAGGLEAIHEFFDHTNNINHFSYVVIQHLSPDYKSLLVELVSKHTNMHVVEAGDKMKVKPGYVYIIPNNKLMTINKGRLILNEKIKEKAPNTAIDTFLFSLAEDQKKKAIAIILSGTGTDGTKGIESIKECDGLVLVQEPASAKFDGMPNSAISSGNADIITEPKNMSQELENLLFGNKPQINLKTDAVNEALEEIFIRIYNETGYDFNYYKSPTIIRRIERRMGHLEYADLNDYVNFLKSNSEETKILGKEFLIGVTKFFRDKEAFDVLYDKVIPVIVDGKKDHEIIKVWICACSSGEEAYSIAIKFDQYLQKVDRKLEVKIFATDIDDTSLAIAQKNCYPGNIEKDIDKEIIANYFLKRDDHYEVIERIRKQIVFAKHNVIKNPPFIKNDLVSCRNMLIYVNHILQQKLLATFHFALLENAFLFLGPSESPTFIKDGIEEINGKWKIFKKVSNAKFLTQEIYKNTNADRERGGSLTNFKSREKKEADSLSNIENDLQKVLLEELGYVGVYINQEYDIKETIGDFKKFLSLPDKKLNLNLLKMVPQQLAIVINTAVRKAHKEDKTVRLNKIISSKEKESLLINIVVKPVQNRRLTFILFNEATPNQPVLHQEAPILLPDEQQSEYMLELEAELNETKAILQTTVEEMETTNEELQSSNEELLSANEELQSSNEELQSLNEELHTLNTEHQAKIRELIELNDDLNNYFRSTDIGQIFIDSNLKIRKFNPAAIRLVNLIETDIGRPINHISTNLQYDNLLSDIKTVMLDNEIIEKEILLSNGSQSLMRVLPYIRQDKKIDGVVVTFLDISAVSELNNIIKGTFNSSKSAIMAFKAVRNTEGHIIDFRCLTANEAAKSFLNSSLEDLKGLSLIEQAPQIISNGFFDKYVQVVTANNIFQTEYQDKNENWFQVVAVKMQDGFVATFTNITDKKIADKKLKKNYNELIIARENLRKLNLELEGKVNDRTKELSESEERFSLVSKATNDTIWDWNLVNNTMWRSDNITKMFGYAKNRETLTLDFWINKIHPDEREQVRASIFHAINNTINHWTAEYRFLKADGEYAFVLDRAQILTDDNNTPFRMLGSVVDITKLNEAEKRFTDSESRFKKIFESNMIGMVFSDLEGNLLETNEAFNSMVGYNKEEIIKKKLNWNCLTPPDFIDISKNALKEVRELGLSKPHENKCLRKDGSTLNVLVGSAKINDEEYSNIITYVIDITEKKNAEERQKQLQLLIKKQQDEFYRIFMNAPAHISIKRGKNLKYHFVNKEATDFLGIKDPIGKTVKELASEWTNIDRTAIEEKVLKTGKRFAEKAYPLYKKDPSTGETITNWFDFIIEPVYDDHGNIDGVASFAFNVTDLIKSQKATNQLMHKKDEFMSIASHELKTPITSMKAIMQILQRRTQENITIDGVHQFILKANNQIDRLTSLVNDLLDVTKIHAGKLQLNNVKFSSQELLDESIENIIDQKHKHRITVYKKENVELIADKNRLEQVINNFISNAIKYSPEANQVIITTELIDNQFKLSIEDFGIGIPEDKAEYIFDRFFRVQESSQKFSGLGLGLYICAEIIKRHGGKIGVNSKEGEGSIFWFIIPQKQPVDNKNLI